VNEVDATGERNLTEGAELPQTYSLPRLIGIVEYSARSNDLAVLVLSVM
jgi:hypothetical protein